jgi:ppGpp synthetase/RelA/SpoT-type nucleotidyltranferase
MEKLTPDAAIKLIREIVQDRGIRITGYFKTRMADRGYDIQDVMNILERGAVTEVQDHESGNIRYQVEGVGLDDHPGTVIVEIGRGGVVTGITVKR